MGVAALYTVNVFDIKEGFISIVTQMFVQLQFFNIYHETRRLSRGGGGGKEFCLLTSNHLVSWICFNWNFQRFFYLGFNEITTRPGDCLVVGVGEKNFVSHFKLLSFMDFF